MKSRALCNSSRTFSISLCVVRPIKTLKKWSAAKIKNTQPLKLKTISVKIHKVTYSILCYSSLILKLNKKVIGFFDSTGFSCFLK